MTSRPRLELVHHHPGRLRLRSDALCAGDGSDPTTYATRAARIEESVKALPAVRSVKHNPAAGSVLVEYLPGQIEPDAIVEAIARAGELDPPLSEEELRARRKKPALLAIGAVRELDTLAREVTGDRTDLRFLVPAAMAGLAAYSFVSKKDRLPRWDNLAYWAYSIFQTLHAKEIAESAAEGDEQP